MPNCWTVYERVEGNPENPTEKELEEPIPDDIRDETESSDIEYYLPKGDEYYEVDTT